MLLWDDDGMIRRRRREREREIERKRRKRRKERMMMMNEWINRCDFFNKWSKNSDKRPNRRDDFFHEGKVNMTPASWEQCSRLQQWRWCRYWFFAAYTASVTRNAFHWAGQPPKIAPFRGGSRPPLPSNDLWPAWVSPANGIWIGSAVFAGRLCVTNTRISIATMSR